MKYLIIFAIGCSSAYGAVDQKFIDTLAQTEWDGAGPAPAGDGGKSIGPFQIGLLYWQDALKHDPSIGGVYSDCKGRAYSERIVRAYIDCYAVKRRLGRKPTYRDMARIHNGGPNGYRKGGGYKPTSKKGIAKEANLIKYYKRFRGKLK